MDEALNEASDEDDEMAEPEAEADKDFSFSSWAHGYRYFSGHRERTDSINCTDFTATKANAKR
jgi:hypothetical protein